jgi:hypothetical protein
MKSKSFNIDLYKPKHYHLQLLELLKGLVIVFSKQKLWFDFLKKGSNKGFTTFYLNRFTTLSIAKTRKKGLLPPSNSKMIICLVSFQEVCLINSLDNFSRALSIISTLLLPSFSTTTLPFSLL